MKHNLTHVVKLILCKLFQIISYFVSIPISPIRNAIPPINDDILLIPAVELSKRIKKAELTSEQVVKAYIKRIRRVDPIINAVVDKRFDLALEEAQKLDRRLVLARQGDDTEKKLFDLPLVGVPFTVKETIALEGSPFTGGIPKRRSRRASISNPAVQQLRDAGLIAIGSTNTPCMNQWYDSSNMLYGRTNNPYDLARIPGGSSGGEAAALASACSLLGVGSDLAGSIRIPCNFCGVFGHKATPFCVSNESLIPKMQAQQEKLRGVGPMSRYACDLVPMLKHMVKSSELDRLRLDEPVDLTKVNFYYCETLNDPLAVGCRHEINAGLRAVVEHIRSKYQANVERVSLEEFRYGLALWAAELNVAAGTIWSDDHEDGKVHFNPFIELAKKSINLSEYPLGFIVSGFLEKFSSTYGSGKHAHLTAKADKLRLKFNDLLGDNGVLLIPTNPEPAPHHQTTLFKAFNCGYTAVCNTLQAPITQCPLGMSNEGLPYGLQIISKPYNDRLTLALAQELEKTFGGWNPPSRVVFT